MWNASAIGGEYLSAASFLGVAGLILAYGADMLWFPVGYTAGYLVLLVLVAAPLRRSGAYTLPDFAEARLESRAVRRVASVLVVLDRLALPAAAVRRRRADAAARDRRAGLGRRAAGRGRRGVQRRDRRHAQHHLRAGVPVLAQAHRPRRPGDLPALAWRADGAPAPGSDGAPVFRERTDGRGADDTAFVVVDAGATWWSTAPWTARRTTGSRSPSAPATHTRRRATRRR